MADLSLLPTLLGYPGAQVCSEFSEYSLKFVFQLLGFIQEGDYPSIPEIPVRSLMEIQDDSEQSVPTTYIYSPVNSDEK